MPPKATKRKVQTAVSGAGDDPWDSAGERPSRKARSSKTFLGEYDEDPGRIASKQFHSWSDWQTKFNEKERNDKRQFATMLKSRAETHREEIQSLLEKSSGSLQNVGGKHANALREARAVRDSAFSGTLTKNVHEIRQKNPLFETGQQLLKVCRDLIATHEEASRKASERSSEIVDHLRIVREKWSSDTTQLDEVLQFGFDYGTKIVECSVSPSTCDEDKKQILAPDRSSFREAGQTVLDMYQKSTERLNGGTTWGEGVKTYTEKMLAVVAMSEQMH